MLRIALPGSNTDFAQYDIYSIIHNYEVTSLQSNIIMRSIASFDLAGDY